MEDETVGNPSMLRTTDGDALLFTITDDSDSFKVDNSGQIKTAR